MKYLIVIMSVMAFSFSGSAVEKKKAKFSIQKYKNVICNQKYIPMKIEQSLSGHVLNVVFTAQRKIEQFKILKVRGLDGVKIIKFQEQQSGDLMRGESLSSSVELSDFTGLVYVVFDVQLSVNGEQSSHSIPVPVGTLTDKQIKERSKNIKSVQSPSSTDQGKNGSNSLKIQDSSTPVKIHEMQID